MDNPMMMLPLMANMLGIKPTSKSKWMPQWWYRFKQRRQMERALSKWKPVPNIVPEVEVRMMIAQELRDFAEKILGYSHIDPEKSAIRRSNKNVNGSVWLKNFEYKSPNRTTKRQEKRIMRKAVCDANQMLEGMGMAV